MKINRLYLQSFRNHQSSEAVLGRVNYFLGRNNSGKTSVLSAIQWGLTGRCGWTDRAGRGAVDLVRHGQSGAAVALEIEGVGPVVRTLGPAGLTVAGETAAQAAQARLYNLLGADEAALDAALNTGAFMSMSPGEQKNYLFTIFGLRWDISAVEGALLDWANIMKLDSQTAGELAKRVRQCYPPGVTAGPEVLETIEKRLREQRRDARRDLQRCTAARGEAVINYPEGLTTADLPLVVAQIAEVKAARDQLIARMTHQRQTLERRQALENDLGSAEARLEQTREALAAMGPEQAAPPGQPDSSVLQGLSLRIQEAGRELAGLEAQLSSLRQAAGGLSKIKGRCPLAPDLVTCAMTAAERSRLLEGLQSQAAELAEKSARASQWLEGLRLEQARATESYNREAQGQAGAQQAARERARLEAVLSELSGQAARLRGELTELSGLREPELPPLGELDEKLSRGLSLADSLKLALKKEQELAALDEGIKVQQQQLESLELLVLAFGPGGIKMHVLARVLRPFQERVNKSLQRLTGGRYQMGWTPEMNIQINANSIPLPLRLLSTSEQLRVGIALQEAMAAFLGLKFLAIDGADVLDQENRDLLTGCLLDIMEAGEYHQALVFSTVGQVDPVSPGIEGFKMFWLEDGTIREIGGA